MDIIVVNHNRGRTWRFNLGARGAIIWGPMALLLVALMVGSFVAGSQLGGGGKNQATEIASVWADDIADQRSQLEKTREYVLDNTHAIARRLGQLQAQMMRLDAAGQRLTEIADLDSGEFDFSTPPPIGGPETEAAGDFINASSMITQLDAVQRQLDDRERQMRVLEDLLLASRLQKEVRPSGWPIAKGWISSVFGARTDPFTGRRTYHQGVDFAGKEGSDVLAAASGVISYAGPRFGYGNLVEINHGNGYVTRYGHNKSVYVKVGDRVKKGQSVAALGSTGRSTGPHVHFEVLLNGRVVNPSQYIRASR